MKPLATGGRTADAAKADEFDQLKRRIHNKLVDRLDLNKVGELQGDVLRREIRLVVEHLCDTEETFLNRQERERLIEEVLDETFGLGPLEFLLKDPTISDILINGPMNMIIGGGTGSGKTTLLNTLSSFIPNHERIVTIEDAAELQLQQEHVVRLETRPSNIEGKGAITATDLVKNALRMRPERIIIGECRGPETLDMLQAMNTGHDGSLTTLHANTPRDAIARLETMVMMSGFDLPIKAMRQQIASAVNNLIQANRLQGGIRRVTSITEVVGMEQ